MPELPDVETFRRYLKSRVLGKVVERVEVLAPAMLRDISTEQLHSQLRGSRLRTTRRHGKYLFLECEDRGWLLLHFGMTGYPQVGRHGASRDEPRFRVRFLGGESLAFFDRRKLGRIALVRDVDAFIRTRKLGPDALDIGWRTFHARLHRKRGSVKAALMDQHTIAGIGNVYADEILFRARLHPAAEPTAVTVSTWRRVYRSLRTVLDQAVAAGAAPSRLPRTSLLSNRHKNGRCPRCGSRLRTMRLGGRTTYYCAREQRTRT